MAAGGDSNNGGDLTSSEVYNPATQTWVTTTGAMNTARYNFQMVLLPDGNVLAAGGYFNGVLTSSEVYSPATQTWETTTGAMNTARSDFQMVLLPS